MQINIGRRYLKNRAAGQKNLVAAVESKAK